MDLKGQNTNKQPTLVAACSSVTSLTVALPGNGVTAAVSVPTIAALCTVGPPVSCITGCRKKYHIRLSVRDQIKINLST